MDVQISKIKVAKRHRQNLGNLEPLKASIALGRRAIGIDREPRYIEVARERIASVEFGCSLREADKGK